jgi:hypothetical protein
MDIKKVIHKFFKSIGYQIVSNAAFKKIQMNNLMITELSKQYYEFYLKQNYKLQNLTGSEYLQFLELKYGGYITGVSPTNNFYDGSHTGGDRMNVFFHNYSEKYSHYLKPLRNSEEIINVLEIGILRGTGLAVWDEYFENKRIYGFDYDLGNFEQNKNKLLELGAFQKTLPTLKFFDQFADNSDSLKDNFQLKSLDVVIDDAYHSDESIIHTFIELQEYLNDNFIYFIEDNTTAWKKLKRLYPKYNYDYEYNQLTIITNKEINSSNDK